MRNLFARFRETHPVARDLFAQAESITPLRAHPLRCGRGVAKITDGIATLLAGETIGTTFPFTGEGIGKGHGIRRKPLPRFWTRPCDRKTTPGCGIIRRC